MTTDKERQELIDIFNHLKPQVDDCLANQVLPSSITHNGEKVGITIEFRTLGKTVKSQDTLIVERNELLVRIDNLQGHLEVAKNDDDVKRISEFCMLKAEAEDSLKEIDAKLEKISPEKFMPEHSLALIQKFPIGTRVKSKDDGIIGQVTGYRNGAKIGRSNELALIVKVPGDQWVLYTDQVDRYIDQVEKVDKIEEE